MPPSDWDDTRVDKIAAKRNQRKSRRGGGIGRPRTRRLPQQALEVFRMDGGKFGGLAVDQVPVYQLHQGLL